MLPAINDITSGFGSMLASTMDARDISRKQMATSLNDIGKREGDDARIMLELQREAAETEIARLEQLLKDAGELQKITRKDIIQWEKDEAAVSPVALDAIIEVLNHKTPLPPETQAELRRRATALNKALAAGEKVAAADAFSETLNEVMDSYRISRPELAEAIAQIKPQQDITAKLEKEREALSQLPQSIAPKSYTITGRKGKDSPELQTITLRPGSITAEHVHLIEAGAVPSDDLYALLKQALSAREVLKDHEASDLDQTFADKKLELDAPVIMHAPALADVITVTPAAGEPSGLAAKLGLKQIAHTQRKAPPSTELSDALSAYARAYAQVFTIYQLEPPPTEDGNERNGSRTEFAQRALGIAGRMETAEPQDAQMHRKLVKQLRPMTLEPISDEVMDAISLPIAREKLENLNKATLELRSHIMEHSRAGMDTTYMLNDLQSWLSEHNISPEEVRNANNGKALQEMLAPHELKKNVDFPDQMERIVKRLREQRPDAFQEAGNNMPPEFSNFGKKAETLQGYYNQQYAYFNQKLDAAVNATGVGRHSGTAG